MTGIPPLTRLGALILALAAAAPVAAQKPLTIDQDASRVGFEATQMGVTVEGGFSDWDAELRIDEADPAASTARVVVRTASIDAGHGDTNAEVKRGNWLAVERFPEAVFESTAVTRRDDGSWLATGTLRIRDRTETVEVPFTVDKGADGARRITGSFTIKRATFNVGGGAWGDFDVVANEVRIVFDLHARV